jgi:hypothetical protein
VIVRQLLIIKEPCLFAGCGKNFPGKPFSLFPGKAPHLEKAGKSFPPLPEIFS